MTEKDGKPIPYSEYAKPSELNMRIHDYANNRVAIAEARLRDTLKEEYEHKAQNINATWILLFMFFFIGLMVGRFL